MLEKLRHRASPGHHKLAEFETCMDDWRNSGADYFTSRFKPSMYTPWLSTGQTPLDWFQDNQHLYTLTEDDIVARSVPFSFDSIPDASGIYFLLNQDDIAYVGKATGFSFRLSKHSDSFMEFTHCAFLPDIPEAFVLSTESFYIHLFNPVYNRHIPPLDGEWKELLGQLEADGECYKKSVRIHSLGGDAEVVRWKESSPLVTRALVPATFFL